MMIMVIADYSDLYISPISDDDGEDDGNDDGDHNDVDDCDDYDGIDGNLHIPAISDGTDAENQKSCCKELVSNTT